ncbi:hypothetical protein [Nocardioides sp. TF02-7]|uniref:hypothetical protein n=1 Tax=Nocardioides sp. TF02-7 TaxID=2917724 RepID=UPI001F063297|nr:hypothetical protein [Nocardioides sp. TF02-7]UMG91639.1 hypothetical protein MF408_16285 [Nocardioides sp. TF02-7]
MGDRVYGVVEQLVRVGDAGIEQHGVQVAVLLSDKIQQRIDPRIVGNVALNGNGAAHARGLALESLTVARDHEDGGAVRGEPPRSFEAHAGAGAGDEDLSPVDVHCSPSSGSGA